MTMNIFGCFNRFTGMNLLKQSSTRGVVVTWSPHFWLEEAQTTKYKGHLKCVFFFSLSIQTCWHGTMFLGSMYWTHTELNSGLPRGKLCTGTEKVSPASQVFVPCQLLFALPAPGWHHLMSSIVKEVPSSRTPGDWRDSSTLEGCWWTRSHSDF